MLDKKKLERFPDGVLRHVAQTIGNNMSGSEISEFLSNAGYPELSTFTGTKWRHLYDVFKQLNERSEGQLHVAKIVQLFCDKTQWIGREDARRQVMDTLNDGLTHVGLQVNENGNVVITQKRITFKTSRDTQAMPEQPTQMIITPVFRTRDITQDARLCFVLMPFQPAFDRIYKEVLQPRIKSCGFKSLRADDLFSPTPILEDIWTHICKSRVIIADVTGRNPNVFYEIGIAHTVGKPVITITQNTSDIPFDIASFRYFTYSDDQEGWEALHRNVGLALTSVLKESI